jgi:methionine aminopeptidase
LEPITTRFATSSTTSANPAVAASITSDALVEARHLLRSTYETSITQTNVAHHLEAMMRSEGADGALAFPTLVMSGEELTLPHGDPLDDGTHIIDPSTEPLVMIDMGCKYLGHSSDVTRTFFFESATQEMKDAYSAVLAAEEAIIEAIAPGVMISDLDAIVRSHLSDYYGRENVTGLTYWGHGVGRYVHEPPILYNVDEELVADDVLAIEPGLYFDDGWAVRVEDTVIVTETGVEILSNAPKALEDVMIHRAQPYVEADLSFINYEYGYTTTASLSVVDSAMRNVGSVDFFDGYSWMPMVQDFDNEFSLTYILDTSYSSQITSMVRIQFANDTYYFNRIVSTEVEVKTSTSVTFEPPIQVNSDSLPPDSPLVWTLARAGAKLIRIRFEVIDGGGDQFLIKDATSHSFVDYRHVHERFLWTPWIAGDELMIHVVATEPEFLGGVEAFRFTVDMMEYIDEEIQSPTTTETTTTTTSYTITPTTSFTSPDTTTSQDPTTTPEDSPIGQVLITMSGVAMTIIVVGVVVHLFSYGRPDNPLLLSNLT